MGSYIPIKRRRPKSLEETLAEAESDHFLDCPDADFKWRSGAALLDFIFVFLMISGVHHISNLLMHTSLSSELERMSFQQQLAVTGVKLGFECLLVYLVCLWPVATYGGSPGKLLLGLRVIDADSGQLLSFAQVFLREIVGKVLLGTLTIFIGLLLPIFRKDSRALQDIVSNSVVKKVHSR